MSDFYDDGYEAGRRASISEVHALIARAERAEARVTELEAGLRDAQELARRGWRRVLGLWIGREMGVAWEEIRADLLSPEVQPLVAAPDTDTTDEEEAGLLRDEPAAQALPDTTEGGES